MSDDVAAALGEIRENAEQWTPTHDDEDCRPGSSCTAHDALRMVAALNEVLQAHRDVGGSCAWCRTQSGRRARWPCGEYEAISRSLLEDLTLPGRTRGQCRGGPWSFAIEGRAWKKTPSITAF